MPMAISFVGAGVIWKFIYEYRGPENTQIGLLNAIIVSLGYEPQAWLTIPIWNNFFNGYNDFDTNRFSSCHI